MMHRYFALVVLHYNSLAIMMASDFPAIMMQCDLKGTVPEYGYMVFGPNHAL
jgi:hypothetical protein